MKKINNNRLAQIEQHTIRNAPLHQQNRSIGPRHPNPCGIFIRDRKPNQAEERQFLEYRGHGKNPHCPPRQRQWHRFEVVI